MADTIRITRQELMPLISNLRELEDAYAWLRARRDKIHDMRSVETASRVIRDKCRAYDTMLEILENAISSSQSELDQHGFALLMVADEKKAQS